MLRVMDNGSRRTSSGVSPLLLSRPCRKFLLPMWYELLNSQNSIKLGINFSSSILLAKEEVTWPSTRLCWQGSSYFAPVIYCFINDYLGWRWVFYWPAIFLALSFVFLFFFMEETNYDRKTVNVIEAVEASPTESMSATGEIGRAHV